MEEKKLLHKICKWCAYQDRSEYETYQKLLSWRLKEQEISNIIQHLKDENYLNEERFIASFLNGKLNSKKWGIEKIKYQLKQKHHITDEKINQHIKSIDNETYLQQLVQVLDKKKQFLTKKELDYIALRKKIINFALSKGYSLSDILKVLNKLK